MQENLPKDPGLEVVIERIGVDYEVLEYVGGGGLSNIYKVRHKLQGDVRALKIMDVAYLLKIFEKGDVKNIHEKFDNIKQRFTREARIFEKLSHPNISRVYDIGFVNDEARHIEVPYLLMEYIEGVTLADMLKENSPLDIETIIRLSEDILTALGEIHEAGVIHRDIKPANIMVDKNDGRAIIIDFGLARDQADDKSLTMSGIIGTPAYIAPEIFSRKKDVGPGSDIYSFGIVLYEMLAGEKPFEGKNQLELIYESLNITIPDVTKKNPEAPVSLQKIIKKAAAKNPGDRYKSAAELLEALKNVREEQKNKPGSKSLKYLVYLFVIIAVAAFIVINPLGIGKKGISPEEQYHTHMSLAGQYNRSGDYEKALDEVDKAKNIENIEDTREAKKLEAQIKRNLMKKDFRALEKILEGEAAREEKVAACRRFLSKYQHIPANDETKSLVSRTQEYLGLLFLSKAGELFKEKEFYKAYENIKLAKEVINTPEAKELEDKIINGCILEVKKYHKQANYQEAGKYLEEAKKIGAVISRDLEQDIKLLKEMPGHVKEILRKSLIKETRIKREKALWQADFGDGIVMVYIPPGNFKKGKPGELKELYLDGFWMGKTEVSTAQYMKFAKNNKSHNPDYMDESSPHHIETGDGYYNGQEGDDYPIVGIFYHNAEAYCDWLSEKTGLKFQLPSEDQWEKAARGTDGRDYPWGNRKPDRNLANFSSLATKTAEVDSCPQGASPYGMLNMAGNAAERCRDVYPGEEAGARAVRGGSFYTKTVQDLMCFSRKGMKSSERTNALGFRLCLVDEK
jgi:serine/threonine protein kinase/formylglycine-generating enzyme required for sulfatase activity